MLVLTRRSGERIKIGDNVFVTVLEISRGRVRLGFDAPRDVIINRCEIIEGESQYKSQNVENEGEIT
ncbi:MAG TPA: carbon storage regulator [bacterium]|nr:carbon storage regulator [bacterium]